MREKYVYSIHVIVTGSAYLDVQKVLIFEWKL